MLSISHSKRYSALVVQEGTATSVQVCEYVSLTAAKGNPLQQSTSRRRRIEKACATVTSLKHSNEVSFTRQTYCRLHISRYV